MNSVTSQEQIKLGDGRVTHGQVKEVVWNVHKFMKHEADYSVVTNLNQVKNRACKATGISRSDLHKSWKKKIIPYRAQIYILNLALLSCLMLKSATNQVL
jgi:hypothetical protein